MKIKEIKPLPPTGNESLYGIAFPASGPRGDLSPAQALALSLLETRRLMLRMTHIKQRIKEGKDVNNTQKGLADRIEHIHLAFKVLAEAVDQALQEAKTIEGDKIILRETGGNKASRDRSKNELSTTLRSLEEDDD